MHVISLAINGKIANLMATSLHELDRVGYGVHFLVLFRFFFTELHVRCNVIVHRQPPNYWCRRNANQQQTTTVFVAAVFR